MRVVTIFGALLLSASAGSAQSPIRLMGGYQYVHPDFKDVHVSMGDSLKGWLAGVDVSIADHLGIIARADGLYDGVFRQGLVIRPQGDEVRSALYTVTAGPRFSETNGGLTVFGDALFGMAHGKARNIGVDFIAVVDDTRFVGGVGGGVRLQVNRLADLQVDVQYRRTDLFDQTLNVVQVGAGIVLRLAHR
jgi:hypothetical protein